MCVGAGVLVEMGVGVLAGVGVCVGVRSPHATMAIWTTSRSATPTQADSNIGLVVLLRRECAADALCSWGASGARRMVVSGSLVVGKGGL